MNTEQFRTFLVTAEEGTATGAARGSADPSPRSAVNSPRSRRYSARLCSGADREDSSSLLRVGRCSVGRRTLWTPSTRCSRPSPTCSAAGKDERVRSRACSIPGCGRPIVARGWCRSHYDRWKRYGDATHPGSTRARRVRRRRLRSATQPARAVPCPLRPSPPHGRARTRHPSARRGCRRTAPAEPPTAPPAP